MKISKVVKRYSVYLCLVVFLLFGVISLFFTPKFYFERSIKNQSMLNEWFTLRELSEVEVRQRFSVMSVDNNVRYNHLSGLTALNTLTETFYFKDGKLVLIYILHSKDITTDELLNQLGAPEAKLASRAGKSFTQYVYPQKGVAFSSDGKEVAVIEIFQPMSLETYTSTLYENPGEFSK